MWFPLDRDEECKSTGTREEVESHLIVANENRGIPTSWSPPEHGKSRDPEAWFPLDRGKRGKSTGAGQQVEFHLIVATD